MWQKVVIGLLTSFYALFPSHQKERDKMKIREKWQKQNNSIKVLMKKLKVHDTVVVAIAVLIALALCGGLIYLSTPIMTANAKEELENREKADSEQTMDKLDELKDYLTGLDQSITESQENLSEYYENSLLVEDEDDTADAVTEKVTVLGNDLKSVHEIIKSTETNIDSLRESIEKNKELTSTEITERYAEISSGLTEIENQYSSAKESTDRLIEDVKSQMESENSELSNEITDRYTDLLTSLNESSEMLSTQNTETIETFRTEIDTLSADLADRIDVLSSDMNSGFDAQASSVNDMNTAMNDRFDAQASSVNDMNTAMNDRFDAQESNVNDMNTVMNNRFDGVGRSMQITSDDLKNYINTQMDGFNSKFDQVFTSVSNGKRLLASALLTKNQVISQDATFLEIARAIEAIPTQIVLDNGSVAGNIEYDHHYHADGTGTECNETMVSASRAGGCYVAPVRHTHTASCYNVSYMTQYTTANSVTNLGVDHEDELGRTWYRYRCEYCGSEFVGTNPWHHESGDMDTAARRGGYMVDSIETRSLVCGMTEGQLLGYAPGCGLSNGQVVAARITFVDGYGYEPLPIVYPEFEAVPDEIGEYTIHTHYDVDIPDDYAASPEGSSDGAKDEIVAGSENKDEETESNAADGGIEDTGSDETSQP